MPIDDERTRRAARFEAARTRGRRVELVGGLELGGVPTDVFRAVAEQVDSNRARYGTDNGDGLVEQVRAGLIVHGFVIVDVDELEPPASS